MEMSPKTQKLTQELVETLEETIGALRRAKDEDDLNLILELLGGLPGLVRAQLRDPHDLAGIQLRMERVKERLERIVKQPSYSSLPPAARHFRDAGQKASDNPIMKGK